MEPTDETATLSEFARIARYKPSYVTALKSAGRLVLSDDGKRVKVRESLERIAATRDPAKAAVAARHAEARSESITDDSSDEAGGGADDEQEPEGDAPEGESSSYSSWRGRREKALALREERNNALEEGRCLDGPQTIAAITGILVVLRRALENVGDVVGSQLTDINARRLIDESIAAALAEASRQLAALGRKSSE